MQTGRPPFFSSAKTELCLKAVRGEIKSLGRLLTPLLTSCRSPLSPSHCCSLTHPLDMSSSNESGGYHDARYGEAPGPLSPDGPPAESPFQQSQRSAPLTSGGGGTYHPVSRGDRRPSESEVSSNGLANNSTTNLHVPLLGGATHQEPHQLRSRGSSSALNGEKASYGAAKSTAASVSVA